jgi:hypothetical protein
VELEPVVVESKSAAVELEPVVAESKSAAVELEPVVAESKPATVELEPVVAESKPAAVELEPVVAETKSAVVGLEPVVAERKPAVVAGKHAADSKADRPFRVKLRGSVLVLVRLPNKRSVRAAIHQLSTSGGVIHFEKPLDEKLEVELIFHLQKATIRSKAQMLFPMWATQGWMQPFRFVNLPEASKDMLDTSLKSFLGQAKGAAAGA